MGNQFKPDIEMDPETSFPVRGGSPAESALEDMVLLQSVIGPDGMAAMGFDVIAEPGSNDDLASGFGSQDIAEHDKALRNPRFRARQIDQLRRADEKASQDTLTAAFRKMDARQKGLPVAVWGNEVERYNRGRRFVNAVSIESDKRTRGEGADLQKYIPHTLFTYPDGTQREILYRVLLGNTIRILTK